jgi:hypothetical protein
MFIAKLVSGALLVVGTFAALTVPAGQVATARSAGLAAPQWRPVAATAIEAPVVMPALVVRGERPRAPKGGAWRCGPWHELHQGSGVVRDCGWAL